MVCHGTVYLGTLQTARTGLIVQDHGSNAQPAIFKLVTHQLKISECAYGFIGYRHHTAPLIPVLRPDAVIGVGYKPGIGRVGGKGRIEELGKVQVLRLRSKNQSQDQYRYVYAAFHDWPFRSIIIGLSQ